MFTEVGSTAPAHTTGAGKAILAWLPAEDLARLYGGENGSLERLTARTLTGFADLQDDLARIRRQGYAIDNEEHEEGVSCVAAPIFDRAGAPSGAISISGPSPRILNATSADIGTLLRDHAAQISAELGHQAVDEPAASRRIRALNRCFDAGLNATDIR